MTRIFLDTEFTRFDAPRLISFGLVSEAGECFYRELTDTWHPLECSLFTLVQVLPLLDEGRFEATLRRHLGLFFDLLREITAEQGDPGRITAQGGKEVVTLALAIALDPNRDLRRGADYPELRKTLESLDPSAQPGPQAVPALQAARELSQWLGRFDEPLLHYDFSTDRYLLQGLLSAGLQQGMLSSPDGSTINFPHDLQWQEIDLAMPEFDIFPQRPHHALDDARVMMQRWLKQAGG